MRYVIAIAALLHCLELHAQGLHEAFWTKHNHYPPFDIRVTANGQSLTGEFYRMREAALTGVQPGLDGVVYFVPEGVTLDLKVEVSPRAQQQWKDVTGLTPVPPNLGGIDLHYDSAKRAIVALVIGNGASPQDYGYTSIPLAHTPSPDESAMDVIYFYVGPPTGQRTALSEKLRTLPLRTR